jgi:flagellar basal body-associated protein FliL
MEGNQKKGMSKGCLIGLIVAAVIVVIIIIAGITCYLYKDDLAKMGVVTVINGFKTEMANDPVEGVDTVQFNALTDAFITKFNEEKIDYEKYADFFQQIQVMMTDKKLDAEEVVKLEQLMVNYYPDLEGYLPEPEVPDSLLPEETAVPE